MEQKTSKYKLSVDESRRVAREDLAKTYLEHQRKLGHDPSYQSIKDYIDNRADNIDKKKDRNIRD